jgi:hypothetical protein
LDIKPLTLPFFIPFKIDLDKHTLKPYMASVNHNVINETTWLNIVHTFMGNFVTKVTAKNNTTPMEDMGNYSGLPQQCKCIYSKCALFSKMENIVSNVA